MSGNALTRGTPSAISIDTRAGWWPSQAPAWVVMTGSLIVVLALLELFARSGFLSQDVFPPITEDVRALVAQLGEAAFWTALANTLSGWAIALAIVVAGAVPLGILIGASSPLYRAFRVIIEFLRPVPSVALIPLAVLVFGTGLESKVFLAAFAAFWPMFMQTLYGVRAVDPVATDTARSFGFSRLQRLRLVSLPSAVPYLATGLRLAAAVALILVVTAELVIGSPGLGREINEARSAGAFDNMYALIIVTGVLGWAISALFELGERRVLHWHPSQRRGTDHQ